MTHQFRKAAHVEGDVTVSVVNATVTFGDGEEAVEVYETDDPAVAGALRGSGVLEEETVEQEVPADEGQSVEQLQSEVVEARETERTPDANIAGDTSAAGVVVEDDNEVEPEPVDPDDEEDVH